MEIERIFIKTAEMFAYEVGISPLKEAYLSTGKKELQTIKVAGQGKLLQEVVRQGLEPITNKLAKFKQASADWKKLN